MRFEALKKRKQFVIVIVTLFAAIPVLVSGQSGSTEITSDSTVTGDLSVRGALSKGSGSFVIDHPLDPHNKLLIHYFVESPTPQNIYDGTATLNEDGKARVQLPDYTFALNKEFRYLATPIGGAAPDLHIAKKVHRKYFDVMGPPVFTIAGGNPGQKVSWQVTATRHDPYIENNKLDVEVPKSEDTLVDKGEYIFPELYDADTAEE